ncbi:MAG TPA: serine/threonine protein kinase, partial [Symbiobacteriaceae bacterium]|nr:serine/threonine protein kinase [Symbiobacteriaceae bacterium]
VYRRLGIHPAYSRCLHAGEGYLILERLRGVTMYDCFRRGIRIPEQVIHDVDEALAYARSRGLNPRDVHAKNVMVRDGRGMVADVSDFLEPGHCSRWEDLKRVYYRFYRPLLYRYPVPIPSSLLNLIRRGYRLLKRPRES